MAIYIKKETILIVDDNPENLKILNGLLGSRFNIKVANNGRKAISIAESLEPPDLILLDVIMPEMDGFTVCKHLKKNPRTKNIPIIFVTALDNKIDESQGLKAGAVDYITKPFMADIVLARVGTHLALYNQNRVLEYKVKERTYELNETRLQIIRKLSRAAEYKDNETGQHVIRIGKYCQQIGLEYGLSELEIDLLLNVAPMHDIGKIGIPDNVLLKPGKLDPDEWEVMKKHVTIGAEILKSDSNSILMDAAYECALYHHEKWNGDGYPDGKMGAEIPLFPRIVAIADVFDALTSDRPYKRAWSYDDTFEYIEKESGISFMPELVDSFFNSRDAIISIRKRHDG